MIEFMWDLPFQIPIQPGTYQINIGGVLIDFNHSIKEQNQFDLRLGGITGSFGLERDNLGILRFSHLSFALDDHTTEEIQLTLRPEITPVPDVEDPRFVQNMALLISNRFLNKVRRVLVSTDVRPLKVGDLAHLEYRTANNQGRIRLYGGGITLPIAGLGDDAGSDLAREMEDPRQPMRFELDSLDAIRASRDGFGRESTVLAVGALESALDRYLSTHWRRSFPPSRRVPHGLSTLGIKARKNSQKHFTVEDVLRDAGVRKKFDSFVESNQVDEKTKIRIERAIESRNAIVHGGVDLPPRLAERHAESVRFLLRQYLIPLIDESDHLNTSLELLTAYEEATGISCPSPLKRIAGEYLTKRGLSAVLYHERWTDEGISSDHFGTTMVVRVPFTVSRFTPEMVSLALARSIVHFGERSRGIYAEARVSESLPFIDNFEGWSIVASEINRTIWDLALDRVVRQFGFTEALDADIQARANELTAFYNAGYSVPVAGEIRDFVEFMRLAKILSALDPEHRRDLQYIASIAAPKVAARAISVLPALDAVDFQRPGTMLDALIRVHDADLRILASVEIFDPSSAKRFGMGLNSP